MLGVRLLKRLLILEDGSTFLGEGFGSQINSTGEVVLTTAMTGYQKVVTSPTYANQIIVFTTPVLGTYGTNIDDLESLQPVCKGVVCHTYTDSMNVSSPQSFSDYLKNQDIPGIYGIDTRKLVRILSKHNGIMKGSIIDAENDLEHAFDQLHATVLTDQLVDMVSTSKPYPNPDTGRNIVLVDYGVKHSVLRQLSRMNCNTIIVPYTATFQEIKNLCPDGVLLSNGPGNPYTLEDSFETIRQIQANYPTFAIGLGHQLLAIANGAKVKELPRAHRGLNFPVIEIATGRIITVAQNHSYIVDESSLPKDNLIVTHKDLNSGWIEGIKYRKYPTISDQFEPEGAPGPSDGTDVFYDFMHLIDIRKDKINAIRESK